MGKNVTAAQSSNRTQNEEFMNLSPNSETVAYLAWVEAEKTGWDLTVKQCAEAIDVNPRKLQMIVNLKGWMNRFRKVKKDYEIFNNHGGHYFDDPRLIK
jgi:hypothetical protein